jgi:catechol 2,3-dioxygenase-like lactoylglutathione lyase family enzyme
MIRMLVKLVEDFENGKINRRELIRNVTIAAGAGAAGAVSAAGADPVLQATGILHISYQVRDYKKTRDFYTNLLGMKVVTDTGQRCDLHVGNEVIIIRNTTLSSASSKPTEKPGVDHLCYSIANWNKDRVFNELNRRGYKPEPEGPRDLQVKDPDGFHIQLSARQEMPQK